MKKPLISVFTPSYNKHEYVSDAVNSVLGQVYDNFEYWIIDNSTDDKTRKVLKEFKDKRIKYVELSFTPKQRKEFYPTAKILNKYYPQANGEFIFYLSDDDVIYPDCFLACMDYFKKHPTHDMVYFGMEGARERDGYWEPGTPVLANVERGLDTGMDIMYRIDGGQVMHKKSCLDKIEQPYFAFNHKEASTCDGLFLENLGKYYKFYPIKYVLGLHRITKKSVYNK